MRDEDAAAAIGINPTKYKIMAVVISAMVAGLVGFFYASYIRYIDPDLMSPGQVHRVGASGGRGRCLCGGPIVGGLIMIPLSEYLRANFSAVLPGINMLMYAGGAAGGHPVPALRRPGLVYAQQNQTVYR